MVNEEFSAVNLFRKLDQDESMNLSWLIYLCKSLVKSLLPHFP